MTYTFSFVTFAWIFFRSKNVNIGIDYVRRIIVSTLNCPAQYLSSPAGIEVMSYIVPFVLIEWWLRRDERSLRIPARFRPLLYFVLLILIIFSFEKKTNFIYFQF
jgi:alginate O-acetyltransferase complex protein AlgI